MNRRDFLRYLSMGAAAGLTLPLEQVLAAAAVPGNTGANGRVVVVGGGMAGAAVAKYLRLWGGTGVKVTLVEPNAIYYSNIFSNKVLTGDTTLAKLSFNYTALKKNYGINIVNKAVTGIDPLLKQVTLTGGSKLPYEYLVLAPGIAFDASPVSGTGTNKAKIVHAWQAGAQTTALQNQIKAMTNKDTFILTIPPKPYRCPPGPYERACVVADYLTRVKKGGKVIVLDANNGILAEPNNFGKAFTSIHKNITYVPNAILNSIDADTGTVNTAVGSFKGKVINAIPAQRAASIITQSGLGLANDTTGKWAGVDLLSYESTAVAKIHVIGDSHASGQPKAGHIANAEAKVCADAIVRAMRGESPNPNPRTNSACYTPITKTTASWLSVAFKYDPALKTMVPAGAGVVESATINKDNYEEMNKWFSNLMSDTFA
ncbi:MAG: NAD(P)/FAD-dependent oxidoreductase [Candidatus Thiothrix moscowensis]|nr:NAD(P)/FAD-dependent oxidoreductase [Candidatus Thiothrix moscowensis]